MESTRKVVSTRKKTLKRSMPNYSRLYKDIPDESEVQPETIQLLFEVFSKYAPLSKIGYSFRNYYDIGAGVGQTIIGMTHMNSTLQSVGIELVPEKVQIGNRAIEKIKDSSVRRRIELVCISMVDDSVSYSNACWIYVNTISEEINTQLFEKLANEVVKGCVIVSSNSTEHSSFKELNNITLPTNLYNSRVYVYVKI